MANKKNVVTETPAAAPAVAPSAAPIMANSVANIAAVEPKTAEAPVTAKDFIKHFGLDSGPEAQRRNRYMESKLPSSKKGIEGFLNEFASNDHKRREMRKMLEQFTPDDKE